LYEDEYATYLANVRALWTSTEDIELYDFEIRRITVMPENITFFAAYPALGIGVGNMREEQDPTFQLQRSAKYYMMDVRLVYYLKGIDDQQLAKIVLRHIQATLLFLQAHPRLNLGNFFSIENIRIEPSANVYDTGGNSLVKGVRFRFDLKYAQASP
jgi:hypothetical protein